jgi:hypothetical protein
MRLFLAGLLVLAMPAAALAQARGQVLSLGFNNHYRPDCWTPMLVQLTSQSPDPQTYQIQIVQEDLDRDKVTYTQTVALGGNVEGRPATTENFWAYFKPKPVDGGLPDATDLTTTLATLNGELKVFLCDKDGKQLSTLPLTSTILNVDPFRSLGDVSRGRKLILFVSDGNDQPEISDYSQQKGVLEDVDAVAVTPRDLPSKVIGYEAVDAIVWMDADANFLISGTHTPSLEALLQWVRQGGNLVVCQPPEAIKIKPLETILPVGGQINGEWTIPTVDRTDLDILNRLAHPVENLGGQEWPKDLGPFKMARVPALPGAKVDEWMEWKDEGGTSFTPWLARRGVGLGAVTWVAQDLGNAALTRKAKTGWRYVWDRVFDWNNPPDVPEDYKPPSGGFDLWAGAETALDLGSPLSRHGMDLTSTAAVYLAVAGFFFALYWGIAGPGMYLVLALKKRANLSWFLFGATAVAATAVTAVLVKIVVRGAPELRHVSIVRYAMGEPHGVIDSRFGLYIHQDGPKSIGLGDTAPHEISYLTPFSLHPQYASNTDELPSYSEYQIAVPDASDSSAVAVTIPFRSTSKKLQAHWVGEIKGAIELAADTQQVKIDENNNLVGTLINNTGYDLWHVFLGFKQPGVSPGDLDRDAILYVGKWAKDDSLGLHDLTATRNLIDLETPDGRGKIMGAGPSYGWILHARDAVGSWSQFWREEGGDVENNLDYALPMLTFFDRLPPWAQQINQKSNRYELRRHGARLLDLSPAMSAGGLVICARAIVDREDNAAPLPVPLTVSDEPVSGSGTTIYQFVLPLDRTAVSNMPSTKPSGQ